MTSLLKPNIIVEKQAPCGVQHTYPIKPFANTHSQSNPSISLSLSCIVIAAAIMTANKGKFKPIIPFNNSNIIATTTSAIVTLRGVNNPLNLKSKSLSLFPICSARTAVPCPITTPHNSGAIDNRTIPRRVGGRGVGAGVVVHC